MKTIIFAGLFSVLMLSGCKSFMEFKVPQEFDGGKVIEDPPGTMLPLPEPEFRTC